jgi:hypothetical protein
VPQQCFRRVAVTWFGARRRFGSQVAVAIRVGKYRQVVARRPVGVVSSAEGLSAEVGDKKVHGQG